MVAGGYPLLERVMGDPIMTRYVGGPEHPEHIRYRHEHYCQMSDEGKMFVIGQERVAVGSVGYWTTEWQGQWVWETGWSVLLEFQRQGIATKATAAVVKQVHAEGKEKHRYLHAFPSVDNAASNDVCRKVGFIFQREVEMESWRERGKLAL
jgi:RimJ/RimL family protein N-acetyltransferase